MTDELHGRPESTARKAFHRHIDQFIEHEDFFNVPYDEWSQTLCVPYMDAQNSRHDFINSLLNPAT
ncbi:hypothetical protein [Desulfonema magnum]|uniref:hypothetical protein n=1 Tax=Desulfonema magnum TaxID=45655 RepID=UPI001A9AE20F